MYVSQSFKEKSNYQQLVNTSLPAKEAPTLKPATLASLTTVKDTVSSVANSMSNLQFEKKPAYQPLTESSLTESSLTKSSLTKSSLTSDDFPSLVSKKPVASTTASASQKSNMTNFAALSREWAKKQEEDKIAEKEAADKERFRQQYELMMREKNEKEFKEFRNRTIALPSLKKNNDDTRILDIGCYKNNVLEDDYDYEYESPPEYNPEYEEEEEEEEEEYNAYVGCR